MGDAGGSGEAGGTGEAIGIGDVGGILAVRSVAMSVTVSWIHETDFWNCGA
jgi:hypothetical protein